MKISIIIPCHNAIGKVEKCIASLRMQDFDPAQYEVLFIDDCSTDQTHDYLLRESTGTGNWRVFRTERNSGSPSLPRNIGIREATGDYVFFLDCDDTIFPDTLSVHFNFAIDNDSCLIRGYLVVDNGTARIEMNRVPDFGGAKNRKAQVERIIRNQSTTVPSLIKREMLIREGITWDESLRVGEDTVFLIQVMAACKRIGYLDHPTFVYNKATSRVASSTQAYGARELRNHLDVWQRAEKMLGTLGLSFVAIRFQVALQTVLQAVIRYSRDDIDRALFLEFSDFIRNHWKTVRNFRFSKRFQDLLVLLHAGEYEAFFAEAKPRLLIAGYDLKFIEPMIPRLSAHYQVRVDEWTGHDSHDVAGSTAALEWAEVIFCEWLLGNAVWYSINKRKDQKLIVRAHRFELGREFGRLVVDANVDVYVTVSVLYFERMIEIFGIARGKVRLLPNYIDAERYASSADSARRFNLALIGALPSRKGLMKALAILDRLRMVDQRYNLSVYGRNPHEVHWIQKNSAECEYYRMCDVFIESKGLDAHVKFVGHVDVTKALAGIGFVLSVSDDEWLPESFHLAPADGFAAGGQGLLLRWSGAEFLYPAENIFESIEDICERIRSDDLASDFEQEKRDGREFIMKYYAMDLFLNRLVDIIKEIC